MVIISNLICSTNVFVTTLTLNRTEAANALSVTLIEELMTTLEQIENDPKTRVVILTGSGNRFFCAGADLKERKEMSIEQAQRTVKLIGQLMNFTASYKKPLICVLNGLALGGGLELALACDIRLASSEARLGLTETSLGIMPGAGGTQRLARLIGEARAKELIYTAKILNAKEALDFGIIQYCYSSDELLQQATALAQAIANNAPLAVQQAKLAINTGIQTDLSNGLIIESLAYAPLFHTEDRIEGLQAFAEKRKPKYKGQ